MSLTIALPKGRMSEECLEYFFDCGISSLKEIPKDRQLIVEDKENNIRYLLIRSQDVGTYVERGAADLGILGMDVLSENQFSISTIQELPLGFCKLCVAFPKSQEDWSSKKHLRVATKYIQNSRRFFYEMGINVDFVKLYGSVEIAPLTGIADVIVDLVSTGATLKANQLICGQSILESYAHLVANPSSLLFKKEAIFEILNKLNLKKV